MTENIGKEVKKSERVKHPNIFAALSAFQGELKTMPKTMHVEFTKKAGGILKFDYTPLGEIMNTIYPLLAKNGLSVRHAIVRGGTLGTKEGVEAILTHETYVRKVGMVLQKVTKDDVPSQENIVTTGEYQVEGEIRSGVIYINQGSDMKEMGGAITYARRYTLTQLLGIASEDDLDARLFEDRAGAAMGFVLSKAKQGIKNSKTIVEIDKQMSVLMSDLVSIRNKKAGALGLTKEQCEELIESAKQKRMEIQMDSPQTPTQTSNTTK